MGELTHLDSDGAAHMVDVGDKTPSVRTARAQAHVRMEAATLALCLSGQAKKGDVFAAARIAGIMAAKQTSSLIPLCHPIALTKVSVDISPGPEGVIIATLARSEGKTGVEMEALTAASIAALTIYDMLKAVERGMSIEQIQLVEKSGGKSGYWRR